MSKPLNLKFLLQGEGQRDQCRGQYMKPMFMLIGGDGEGDGGSHDSLIESFAPIQISEVTAP